MALSPPSPASPLSARNEVLTVLPAPLDEAELEAAARATPTPPRS